MNHHCKIRRFAESKQSTNLKKYRLPRLAFGSSRNDEKFGLLRRIYDSSRNDDSVDSAFKTTKGFSVWLSWFLRFLRLRLDLESAKPRKSQKPRNANLEAN